MNFCHLHLHTQFSFYQSTIKIEELAHKLNTIEHKACAITDNGNMHGAIAFYQILRSHSLKPIIGHGFSIVKNRKEFSTPLSHLNVLCKNKDGYKNLIKLSSLSYTDTHPHNIQCIDFELLEKFSENLIAIFSLPTEESNLLNTHNSNQYIELLQHYKSIFADSFYLEIWNDYSEQQIKNNNATLKIAKEINIPLVGSNNCCYLNKEDAYYHWIFKLIGEQKKISSEEENIEGHNYLKNTEEMQQALQRYPEECFTNTIKICEQCDVDLQNTQFYLPSLPNKENIGDKELLKKLAHSGLEKKLALIKYSSEQKKLEVREKYITQLEYELEVINSKNYAGYFLIVTDFVVWSKKNGVMVGPGRGSGAGSLVSYTLGITTIDPLKYNLIFERFLNPGRKSMPDLDIDFDANGRDKVIEYVRNKYGKDRVCRMAAIGKLQARGVIRAVARVLSYSYSQADALVKLIPQELNITLQGAFQKSNELAHIKDNGSEIEKKILNIAQKLEHLNTNLTTHAAGVIIMNTAINEHIPVCYPKDGEVLQTQYTMEYAENQGAVKFDFLGLRNLTVISQTIDMMKNRYTLPDFDIETIPIDDNKTFQLLQNGFTVGIFQLETSQVAINLLRKMNVNSLDDITALLALNRPGPLKSGMVDNFFRGMKDKTTITYETPQLKPIIENTYGVTLYQEQVIQIATKIG